MKALGSFLGVCAIAFTLAGTLPAEVASAASSCDISGVDRVVAVGDVHGAYDRYVEILRAAGVIDEQLKWSGGKTHLVQLGDVVDRGPDSRKALDLLRRLEGEAAGAGGEVHALIGNHEVMRMLGDWRYVNPGEYAAFTTPQSEDLRNAAIQASPADSREELLKNTPLGYIEMHRAFDREGEYGKWLRGLNVVVKINGTLFLHGGISPAVASSPCATINDTVRRELTSDLDKTRTAPLSSLAAREDGPLWYRGLAMEPDTFAPQVDQILGAQDAHAIVIAHTVVPDGRVRARFGGKVIQMDTGMQPAYVPTGRASALQIEGGVMTAIYTDRRDIISGGINSGNR